MYIMCRWKPWIPQLETTDRHRFMRRSVSVSFCLTPRNHTTVHRWATMRRSPFLLPLTTHHRCCRIRLSRFVWRGIRPDICTVKQESVRISTLAPVVTVKVVRFNKNWLDFNNQTSCWFTKWRLVVNTTSLWSFIFQIWCETFTWTFLDFRL